MSSFIPETAPFSDEQRAWLNGFFNGLMGIQSGHSPSDALAAAGINALPVGNENVSSDGEDEDEEFPWHDSALPIVDRMDMAEGKPLKHRLMAAMAQLDCGTCGYVCKTYAEAIASGEEANLGLCSPGGKETKRTLKTLLADEGAADNSKGGETQRIPEAGETEVGSRNNPLVATLIESRPLNKQGSAKDTRHVAIDLNGSKFSYQVGDALGVFPTNCSELVSTIIREINADATVPVTTPLGHQKPLNQALAEDCCLKEPSDELLELLLAHHPDGDNKASLQLWLERGSPEGFDVLDALQLAQCTTVTATEFVESLEPLNPRLYSIASSMKHVGNQVHLTVGKVEFEHEGRWRKGVASTMLADRIEPGTDLRVFLQPNHGGFTVPADPATPMIMIGPGTGIAPFMAFLQERDATNAPGENWLFFGDRRQDVDFLYQQELLAHVQSGLLTKLDTAFSRDSDCKVYVQDRMRENAAELWKWIQKGAHLYVCGDAKRMAKDVHETLVAIVCQHGAMTEQQANEYIKAMQAENRYARDVY